MSQSEPSGEAKLASLRAAKEQTFRLSDDELASLAQAAENLPDEDSTGARPAPDAFVYTVAYDGRTAKTDDPNLRKSGFSPLIGELQKIVDAKRG